MAVVRGDRVLLFDWQTGGGGLRWERVFLFDAGKDTYSKVQRSIGSSYAEGVQISRKPTVLETHFGAVWALHIRGYLDLSLPGL